MDNARPAGRTLIHKGGAFNARVYRLGPGDAPTAIEKDFSQSVWIVRNTIGRFLVWRETWILRRLAGSKIVPGGVCRLSAFRMREDFCPGFELHAFADAAYHGGKYVPPEIPGVSADMLRAPVPHAFFESLEEEVQAVHRAGFVHLDLHNSRNILVGPGFRPVLIDWQSALPTRWLPGPLRRILERIDLAGVYKFWEKFRPGELPEDRRRFLSRAFFIRRHFWVPRVHHAEHRSSQPKGST